MWHSWFWCGGFWRVECAPPQSEWMARLLLSLVVMLALAVRQLENWAGEVSQKVSSVLIVLKDRGCCLFYTKHPIYIITDSKTLRLTNNILVTNFPNSVGSWLMISHQISWIDNELLHDPANRQAYSQINCTENITSSNFELMGKYCCKVNVQEKGVAPLRKASLNLPLLWTETRAILIVEKSMSVDGILFQVPRWWWHAETHTWQRRWQQKSRRRLGESWWWWSLILHHLPLSEPLQQISRTGRAGFICW